MGTKTNIAWTDTTWNPVIGCSKVSPGCAHCYAEQLSLSPKMRKFGYTGLPWTPANAGLNVQLKPERLEQPLHWREPRRVFVNSMSDMFHENVPLDFLADVFNIMACATLTCRGHKWDEHTSECWAGPSHIFQVLTKRPERMQKVLTEELPEHVFNHWPGDTPLAIAMETEWPLPNVWLGTSVENQHWADIRVPLLLETPAAVRFLSCEPLLGPVDLHDYLWEEAGPAWAGENRADPSLDWVIVGGESGPHYRPMNLDWARSLRDQCHEAGVAFFFKQSGGSRSETGKELDGVRWEQMPA